MAVWILNCSEGVYFCLSLLSNTDRLRVIGRLCPFFYFLVFTFSIIQVVLIFSLSGKVS